MSLLVLLMAFLAVFGVGVPARADNPPQVVVLQPSASSPRMPGTGEFSRDVLGDPWDFDSVADGTLYYNMGTPTVVNGILTATASNNDPYFFLLHNGYDGAQTVGRTGVTYPIDPARYRLLSIRMNVSASSGMYIYWYRKPIGAPGASMHVSPFIPVNPGWAIYRVRMDSLSSAWLTGPSGTNLIHGLRIDPTSVPGSSIQIDWVRLSEVGGDAHKVTISWIASDDVSAVVRVYHDVDSVGFDGQLIWGPVPATGQVDSVRWSTAHLPYPAGFVYVHVSDGVNPPVRQYAPAGLKVNDVPRLRILDPDEFGPQEFGLEVQQNSWDMSGPEDVSMLVQMGNVQYSNGILWGVTTGDDPQIFMPIIRPINTRRYGAAHIRQWVNSWTVMRLLWRHTATSAWHTTDDFVMHPPQEGIAFFGPQWNDYRVADMTSLLMEPGDQPWDGSIGSILRLDPTEHTGVTVGVDHFYLYTHDMAETTFTLRWALSDAEDQATLRWYYKTSPTASESSLIVTLSNVAPGLGSWVWDVRALPSGTYYVSCTASDPLNTVRQQAKGVLILNRSPTFLFLTPGPTDYVPPGDDFPSQVLGNAWDMSGPQDMTLISGFNPDSTTWTNGVFRSVTSNNDPYFLWVLSSPIPAASYPTMAFCMYVDDPQNRQQWAVVNWNANGQWFWTNPIPVSEGWHVYQIPLDSYAGWSGSVTQLRLDHVQMANVVVAVDWIRIPVPFSSTFTIRWNATDPDDDASIDLWAFQGSWQGARISVAQGISENATAQYLWDLSFLPEGAYFLEGRIDDGINLPDTVRATYPLLVQSAPLFPVTLWGSLSGENLLLTWSPAGSGVYRYRVYRGTSPHFALSAGSVVATLPFWQTSYQAPLGSALGNPTLNYFYRVTWLTPQLLESLPSNVVGEFEFALDPGGSNR